MARPASYGEGIFGLSSINHPCPDLGPGPALVGKAQLASAVPRPARP